MNMELAKKLYNYMDMEASHIADDLKHGYLTENTGRDGKDYIWYMDESWCIAIDTDGNILQDPDKFDELFA